MPFHLCLALKGPHCEHPDFLMEFLSSGQFLDWQQYHRQFNLSFEKTDHFWAMHLADYRNAHSDGAWSIRPIDMLPWVDPYADGEDEFLAQMRSFANLVYQQPQSPP
jgi:hypothetical protein